MKKIYTFIASLLIGVVCYAATPSAAEILEDAVETVRSAPSISTNLSIITENKSTKGSMVLAGDRFSFSAGQISVWFDGTTLWSYSANTNEVNVSEPTDEELQEINPFVFIKSARKDYKPRLVSSDDKTYLVELMPMSTAVQMKKIELRISKNTSLPTAINLYTPDASYKITLSNTAVGKPLPDISFQFDESLFPTAEIIDLR